MTSYRDLLLDEARDMINGPRDTEYGDATSNFTDIAKMWEPIFGTEVNAEQVALALVALKLLRLAKKTDHRDSWIDLAGYAALGYEAQITRKMREEYRDVYV